MKVFLDETVFGGTCFGMQILQFKLILSETDLDEGVLRWNGFCCSKRQKQKINKPQTLRKVTRLGETSWCCCMSCSPLDHSAAALFFGQVFFLALYSKKAWLFVSDADNDCKNQGFEDFGQHWEVHNLGLKLKKCFFFSGLQLLKGKTEFGQTNQILSVVRIWPNVFVQHCGACSTFEFVCSRFSGVFNIVGVQNS